MDEYRFANTDVFQGRPRRRSRTGQDGTLNPILQIGRKLANLVLLKDQVIRQHAILIGRKPRPPRFAAGKILRVSNRSDAITHSQPPNFLTHGSDLTGSIVAWDSVGGHGPGVAAVGDVGVAVVDGDGVDLDEDGCWREGGRERFGLDFEFGCVGTVVVGAAVCHVELGFLHFCMFVDSNSF